MTDFDELNKKQIRHKEVEDISRMIEAAGLDGDENDLPVDQQPIPTKSEKKKISNDQFRIRHLFQGRLVSNDLLERQWKTIAVFVFLILLYITNRYACQQKMGEIGQLQKQLIDVRYEALSLSSKLMGASRQSQVKSLIDAKNMRLEEIKEAPFRIYKNIESDGN